MPSLCSARAQQQRVRAVGKLVQVCTRNSYTRWVSFPRSGNKRLFPNAALKILVYPVRRNHATSNNNASILRHLEQCRTSNNVQHLRHPHHQIWLRLQKTHRTCEFHVRILSSEAGGGHGNPTLFGWDFVHSNLQNALDFFVIWREE